VLFATLNFKRMFTPEPLPASMQDAYLLWFANDYAARAKEELAKTEKNVLVSFIRAIHDHMGSIDPTKGSPCFNASNIRFDFKANDDIRLRGEPLVIFRLKAAWRIINPFGFEFKDSEVTTALRDTTGAHNPSDRSLTANLRCPFASLAMNTPGTNGPGFKDGQRIADKDLPWEMFTHSCDCWAVTRSFWDACVAEPAEVVYAQVTLEQIRAVTIKTDEGLVNAHELFTNKNWRGFHTRDTPAEGYDFDDPAMDPAKLYERYESSSAEGESTSRSTLNDMSVTVDLADVPSQDLADVHSQDLEESFWGIDGMDSDAASSAMSLA
jgi:hypothetical protein